MSIAEQLHQLDGIDARIARLQTELADARRRMSRNPALAAAESRVDVLQTRERSAAAELRERDGELASVEARIERDGGRMYGGQIVDARELASLEREIEHHRAQRDVAEEQALALMEEIEEIQEQLAARRREANALQEQWETDRVTLTRDVERMTDALAGARQERETLAATIDPKALDLYTVTRARSGHAVATLSNGVCDACRVTLPPRDIQRARAGALVACPNCTRILYAGR